ncbi:MAG: hypothetical protein ABL901_02460 [Hyphomicrobiaceae bacterium]
MNQTRNPFTDLTELSTRLTVCENSEELELRAELRINQSPIIAEDLQFQVSLKRVYISVEPMGFSEVPGTRMNDDVQRSVTSPQSNKTQNMTSETKAGVKVKLGLGTSPKDNKASVDVELEKKMKLTEKDTTKVARSRKEKIVTAVAGSKWQVQLPDGKPLTAKYLADEDVLCRYIRALKAKSLSGKFLHDFNGSFLSSAASNPLSVAKATAFGLLLAG